MIKSIIAESPYFDMLLRDFKSATAKDISTRRISGTRIKCHVCEESRCTLFKAGKDTYICKDCKMLLEELNKE